MFVGMFDYSDLMTYILLVLKKMEVPLEDQTMEIRDLIQKTNRSQNVPVKLVSGKMSRPVISPCRCCSCGVKWMTAYLLQLFSFLDGFCLFSFLDLSGNDPFCTVLAETKLGGVVNDFGTGIHRGNVKHCERCLCVRVFGIHGRIKKNDCMIMGAGLGPVMSCIRLLTVRLAF